MLSRDEAQMGEIKQLRHARVQRGGSDRPPPTPLEEYTAIGFLSNTGPDPLGSQNATKNSK